MEESKIDVPNIDKLFHFIEYFVLGYLWARALTYTLSNPNYLYIFIAAVFISTLYGISDELHQLFVPARSCNAIDLLFDFMGAAAGAGLSVYKERIKRAIDKTV